MTAKFEKLELHLGTAPLSRAHVRRIKACGGTYSECRSPYAGKRFVTIPATEAALVDELVKAYSYDWTKKVTIVARGGVEGYDGRPAWVVVHDVNPHAPGAFEQFARKFAAAYVQATARGLIRNV